MGVLKRVNGGWSGSMDQWRHWSGSMGVLKRVNGGVGQGQWGHWSGSMGCIEKGQWVLVRVNGGIEQWGLNGGIDKD